MPSPFDHIVVLDFEATCNNGAPPNPQEIIEFPSVLLSVEDGEVVDEFPSFVRPVHHPQLSDFCRELTGIEQADVDAAPTFLDVLAAHQTWLASRDIEPFMFMTCGDWDLARMLPSQCATAGAPIPAVYRRWCNVKVAFSQIFRRSRASGMTSMLRTLGLELQGRHHRGIDDSHNIARIALALHDRGVNLDITNQLMPTMFPDLPLSLVARDQTIEVILKKRTLTALLGLASSILRTNITRAVGPHGDLTTDEALFDLLPGATVRALGPTDA